MCVCGESTAAVVAEEDGGRREEKKRSFLEDHPVYGVFNQDVCHWVSYVL